MDNHVPTYPFDASFDNLAKSEMTRWHIPGISICVVDGDTTYFKSYGFARLPNEKMNTDSLFPICGSTKAFTAAVMSRFIEEKLQDTTTPIRWSTPIKTILRHDFVLRDEHTTAVTTIEDALSHRSGLPDTRSVGALRDAGLSLKETVHRLQHIPLAHDTDRRRFAYSDESYQVISLLLERLTSSSLSQLMDSHLWDPLKMRNTCLSVKEVQRDPHKARRLVQGYIWDGESQRHIPEPYRDYDASSGATAGVSSTRDYAKWLRCLLFETAPLSPAAHRAIKFPCTVVERGTGFDHFLTPEQHYHLYTLGWFLDTYHEEQLYWHAGDQVGASIIVGFLPLRRFGFTIMANTQFAQPAQTMLCKSLMDRRLGFVSLDSFRYPPIAIPQPLVAAGGSEAYRSTPLQYLLPHSLLLHEYGGTYENPWFGSVALAVQGGVLCLDLRDQICHATLRLTHAHMEFFLVKQETEASRREIFQWMTVEFRIESRRAKGMTIHLPNIPGTQIDFTRTSNVSLSKFSCCSL